MSEKHGCSGHVAVQDEDGKWWCFQHAPSRVKARIEQQQTAWDTERERKRRVEGQAKARAAELSAQLGLRVVASQHYTASLRGWHMTLADEYVSLG